MEEKEEREEVLKQEENEPHGRSKGEGGKGEGVWRRIRRQRMGRRRRGK